MFYDRMEKQINCKDYSGVIICMVNYPTNRNKTYATSFLYRFVAYVLEQDLVNDERGLRSPKFNVINS